MKVLRENRITLAVQAAGRTDSGVHARQQVCGRDAFYLT